MAPARIDPVESFNSGFVGRSDALTADEVLTELAASLPGTQQLVLVDGHETTVDVSTIPAARIERIDVSTTGVMPDGRPRFNGTVINIILKQQYNGANFAARARDSFAGGGGQSQLNASGGYTIGNLSGFANVIHREQDPLLASERDFSQVQNYASLGGSDYRTPFGLAPVVQAVSGPLNGVRDSNGNPVSIALAPAALSSTPLTPADFSAPAAGTTSPAGLRHFNTSAYIYLIAPSSADVLSGDLTYETTSTTKLHAGYSYTRSKSQQYAPPPVTSIGSESVVPAAYSPFGQDTEVGLVHAGFGPVRNESNTDRHMAYLSADGKVAGNWEWEARFELNSRNSDSAARDLDPILFAASLAATNPAIRFNPFAADGPGSANAALYPSLATVRSSVGTTDDTKLRANAHGQLSDGWVEPILLSVSFDRNTDDNKQKIDPGISLGPLVNTSTDLISSRVAANLDVPAFRVRELESPAVLTVATYATRDEQSSIDSLTPTPGRLDLSTFAASGLLNIPWVTPADERRHSYDLQTKFGIGMLRTGGETDLTDSVGALWSPAKPLTLRIDFSRQQSPVPYTVYLPTIAYNQTLIDRLRADAIANNVEVVSGQPDVTRPPLVTRLFASAQWVPPNLEKLRLMLSYSDLTQKGQQRVFSAQDILDNEQALSSRVTRLAPTADDLAAGLPGEISQVDITPFTGGRREDRVVNALINYTVTNPTLGTLTWRGSTQRVLSSSNELASGMQVVSTNDQEQPAAWSASGQADWWRGSWSASGIFRYLGAGSYAGLPYASFGTLDARVAYQFVKPLGGWLGREVRVGFGIQNLFDRNPPFANTITGTRGGSPLGRSFEVTVRAAVGE